MNQTIVILTIDHKKPLPAGATDVIAQRFYMWAYSQGVEVGVRATVAQQPKEPGDASE